MDLLGRSGKIKEALLIILKLVALPDSSIWASLLAAARVHEEQDNAGYFTLLSKCTGQCGEVE